MTQIARLSHYIIVIRNIMTKRVVQIHECEVLSKWEAISAAKKRYPEYCDGNHVFKQRKEI